MGAYDTWKVNTDAEYHEEGDVPTPAPPAARARRIASA